MKACDPDTGVWYYFIDKCLPFGVSISCAIFQRVSNTLAHLANYQLVRLVPERVITNYLDDFLNITTSELHCNRMLTVFHEICKNLGVPIVKEKTVWASLLVIFLGILLDGQKHILALPLEKIDKAVYALKLFIGSKKVALKQVQQLDY